MPFGLSGNRSIIFGLPPDRIRIFCAGREEPNCLQNNSDPPLRKCSSISGQLTFPRYTLMWFIHALDAIFELMAVVRKLLRSSRCARGRRRLVLDQPPAPAAHLADAPCDTRHLHSPRFFATR